MKVKLENVGLSIKGKTILQNINMTMESGHIYGLWGRNASGKTMLLRVISGLLRSFEGSIWFDEKKLWKDMDFPDSLGVLIESPGFLDFLTGLDNLELIADIQKKAEREDICQTLSRVGLAAEDKRKVRQYSLGMKQKLGIACAIMEKPDVIFLDEPMNALDYESRNQIRTILKEEKDRGALVLVASHEKEDFDTLFDDIFVIEEGQIGHTNQK